jgi:hypothetical protein
VDPNANLEEQRRLVAEIFELEGSDEWMAETKIRHKAIRLIELVQALDEWIQKGGFLPQAWGKCGDIVELERYGRQAPREPNR